MRMKGSGLMEEFLPLCSTTHTSHLGTEKTPRGFFFKPQTRRNPNTTTEHESSTNKETAGVSSVPEEDCYHLSREIRKRSFLKKKCFSSSSSSSSWGLDLSRPPTSNPQKPKSVKIQNPITTADLL
jgi:hypothetical protein